MLDALARTPALAMAATSGIDVEQRRKTMDQITFDSFNSVAESGPAMFEEFTHRVPVADGVIRVRTYRPVPGG
jgi:hypothetical protein